jgi:hypothetical protein
MEDNHALLEKTEIFFKNNYLDFSNVVFAHQGTSLEPSQKNSQKFFLDTRALTGDLLFHTYTFHCNLQYTFMYISIVNRKF